MTELRAIVKEKGLNIYEIILDNEMAITGASRPSIIYSLNQIIDHMESSVRRGLDSEGQLPGPLKVQRKARMLWQQAVPDPDQCLCLRHGGGKCLRRRHRHRADLWFRRGHARSGVCPAA